MQKKITKHELDLRSIEKNLEFLFLAGFMRSVKLIKNTFLTLNKALQYTLQGESGYGRQLADALSTLQHLPSQNCVLFFLTLLSKHLLTTSSGIMMRYNGNSTIWWQKRMMLSTI